MKEELELKLTQKYPNLYRYPGWDNLKSSLLGFGFGCGDGWYKILDELSSDIQYEIDLHSRATRFLWVKNLVYKVLYTPDNIPRMVWRFIGWKLYNIINDWSHTVQNNFRVSQVKEKFGGLRFNTDGPTSAIEALIREAEEKSWSTCEDCGFSTDYGNWNDFKDKNERHIKVKTWRTSWIRTLCEDCIVPYLKEHYNNKVKISDVDPEIKRKR